MSLSTPTRVSVPFAVSGLKATIPASSNNTTGRAGYDQGFPPINMTAKTAGGIPPFGQDFNGILYDVTLALRYMEAGSGFVYDSAFSTAIGGYKVGAMIPRTDGAGFWLNLTDGNTTDPEGSGAVAAGWVPGFAGGYSSVVMTNANVTLTALQYGKPSIIITGLLTANLNLIFPDTANQWVVFNATTGSFVITAKTASGSGVPLSSGANSIVGDATNIYSLNTSLSVASTAEAQAGTNNTNAITPLRMREGFNASGSAPVYACRAWVNFNGTGTVAIRASGNVSSVTDNGVGDYTINFTTAMQDANYSVGTSVAGVNNGSILFTDGADGAATPRTTSNIRIQTRTPSGGASADVVVANINVFR